MQQWHLGFEQELPANSVFALTYAGSKGTKLYTFFNGNQAQPDPNPSDATAPRRPVRPRDRSPSPCSLAIQKIAHRSLNWHRLVPLHRELELQLAAGAVRKALLEGPTVSGVLYIRTLARHRVQCESWADAKQQRFPRLPDSSSRSMEIRTSTCGTVSCSIRFTNCPSDTANSSWGTPAGAAEQVSADGRSRTFSPFPPAIGTRFWIPTETSPIPMEERAACRRRPDR